MSDSTRRSQFVLSVKCAVIMPLSHEEYADVHLVYGFYNDNATDALEKYRQRYSRRRIPDRHEFTRVHQYVGGKDSSPSVKRRAKLQLQRSVEEQGNVTDTLQRSPRTSTRRISVRLGVLRMSLENCMYG
jgi:hypothetical protein